MAGYQNNMRYGRPGNMYHQRNTGCGCEQRMPEHQDRCGCNERRTPEHQNRCDCNERRTPEHQNRCDCNERHMPEHHDNCGCNERQEIRKDCGCGHRRDEFKGMPLAMAYVPWQTWCEIYDICEGFQRGTIFQELDMPFHGRGGCNR